MKNKNMSRKINYNEIFRRKESVVEQTLSSLSILFDKDIFVGKKPPKPIKPASNEIWYTGEFYDMQKVINYVKEIKSSYTEYVGPNIISNKFDGEKWIITFDGDVTATGVLLGSSKAQCYPSFLLIPVEPFYVESNITSVILPDSVTKIGSMSFGNSQFLETVEFSDDVDFIGDEAFTACRALTSIKIPDGIEYIYNLTFHGCNSLNNVVLPVSLTFIGGNAFTECYNLNMMSYKGTQDQWDNVRKDQSCLPNTSTLDAIHCTDGLYNRVCEVIIDRNVTELCRDYTYYDQNYIDLYTQNYYEYEHSAEEYKIDVHSVRPALGDELWTYCEPLTITVDIDGSLVSLFPDASYAQQGYTELYTQNYYPYHGNLNEYVVDTSQYPKEGDNYWTYCYEELGYDSAILELSNGETKYIVNTDTITQSDINSYKNSLVSAVITDRVTSIGNHAFSYCSSLTSVIISNSVTSIGVYAFDSCSSLTSVTCEAINPPSINLNVFDNTNNCPIYVPSESVDTYKVASNWSTYADRIQAIPEIVS